VKKNKSGFTGLRIFCDALVLRGVKIAINYVNLPLKKDRDSTLYIFKIISTS
jgi:hypothetical protein